MNIRFNPNYANGYDSLAEAYLKDGNIVEARKCYLKILSQFPGGLHAENANACQVHEYPLIS